MLFIYSKVLFEYIIDQYGAVILLPEVTIARKVLPCDYAFIIQFFKHNFTHCMNKFILFKIVEIRTC